LTEVRAFVALGANLGDRRATLDGAVASLARTAGLRLVRRSPWIETEPVGGPAGQPRFLNGVIELACTLDAHALLARCQALELAYGRDRSVGPNGPRTLDLDVLLFGDARYDDPDLVVPHPGLEQRRFVLEPLAAIAPDLVLPSGRTVRARLAALEAAPRIGGVR